MITDMFSTCLFFKMGGHFLRLVAGSRAAVDATFTVKRGAPPEAIQRRNGELKHYLVMNYPIGRGMGSSDWSCPRKGLMQYARDLEEFFTAFNGLKMGEYYDNGGIVDTELAKKYMVRGLARVMLRSQPHPPNEGKWTKLGPAFDFFMLADALEALPTLCTVAFGKMTTTDARGHSGPELALHWLLVPSLPLCLFSSG